MDEDKKIKQKNQRLIKTYGISLDEWNEMFERQGGVCWICQQLPKSGVLCVDHRHVPKYKNMNKDDKSKEVRGLLCFMCNVMLSKLERRKTARWLLGRIIQYFNKYKIFGDQ